MKNLHASLHLLCVYQIIMDQVLTLWFIGCAVSCDCYIFVRILWDTVSNCSLLPSVCKAIHNFLSFDFWQIYNFSSFHSQKLSKCLSFYLLKKFFLYKYLTNSTKNIKSLVLNSTICRQPFGNMSPVIMQMTQNGTTICDDRFCII